MSPRTKEQRKMLAVKRIPSAISEKNALTPRRSRNPFTIHFSMMHHSIARNDKSASAVGCVCFPMHCATTTHKNLQISVEKKGMKEDSKRKRKGTLERKFELFFFFTICYNYLSVALTNSRSQRNALVICSKNLAFL